MTAKTSAEYMREWIARPGNREKKQAMNRKKCNTMLGLLNDSVERAVSTIAYLTR